jgi:hypothetical protein
MEDDPLMQSIPWTAVRDSSNRAATDADRLVRREYGGPGAHWLLAQHGQNRKAPARGAVAQATPRGGWIRRVTQALVAIFLVVALLPRQP